MSTKGTDINYISKDLFPKSFQRTMLDDMYDKIAKENKQLQQEKESTIKWIEEEINIKNNTIKEFTYATDEYQKALSRRDTLMIILSKLKGDEKE